MASKAIFAIVRKDKITYFHFYILIKTKELLRYLL